jgi:SAM-dependent methyltransferase
MPPSSESTLPLSIRSPGNLPSSEFGLAMGWVLAHHFLGMNDLHYGYWPQGLPVVPQNLAAAQANYTELLISRIPAGVRSILDVGMGAGTTARKLVEKGYRVDGVSPNGVLTDVARQQLGDRATIFETRFQDLRTERRYDLVLFSESLLFIPLDAAFAQPRAAQVPRGGESLSARAAGRLRHDRRHRPDIRLARPGVLGSAATGVQPAAGAAHRQLPVGHEVRPLEVPQENGSLREQAFQRPPQRRQLQAVQVLPPAPVSEGLAALAQGCEIALAARQER